MDTERLTSEEIEVLIRTQFFKERRGNGQRSTIPASRGHAADSSGIQITMTGQGPLQKNDRPPGYHFKKELVILAVMVITGILLTVEASKGTSVKEERIVHLFIPTSKVVLQAPVIKAENMRLRNRVQPLESLMLQENDLKT